MRLSNSPSRILYAAMLMRTLKAKDAPESSIIVPTEHEDITEQKGVCIISYKENFYLKEFYNPFKSYMGELNLSDSEGREDVIRKIKAIRGEIVPNASLPGVDDIQELLKNISTKDCSSDDIKNFMAVMKDMKTNVDSILNVGFDSLDSGSLPEFYDPVKQAIGILKELGCIESSTPREMFQEMVSSLMAEYLRLLQLPEFKNMDKYYNSIDENHSSFEKYVKSVGNLITVIQSSHDDKLENFINGVIDAVYCLGEFLKEYKPLESCDVDNCHPVLRGEAEKAHFSFIKKNSILVGMSLLAFEGLRLEVAKKHAAEDNLAPLKDLPYFSTSLLRELPYFILAYPMDLSSVPKLQSKLMTPNPPINLD